MGAMIGWTNRFTESGVAFTGTVAGSNVTAEAFDSAYPAANMANADPSKVTRINYVRNSTAGGYSRGKADFSTTLAASKTARIISFMNVRLPSGFTQVLVLGQDYAGGVALAAQTILAANLVPIPGTTDRYNIHVLYAAAATIASASLYVYLPVSTSGYWEIGHVWAGDVLEFTDGANGDWKLSTVDPSLVERARGGALLATKLPHRRLLTCGFDSTTYAQAMGTAGSASTLSYRQFMSEVGVSSPCIVLPRTPVSAAAPTTDEQHYLQTMSVYAAFRGQTEIGHAGGNLFRANATFEEIR